MRKISLLLVVLFVFYIGLSGCAQIALAVSDSAARSGAEKSKTSTDAGSSSLSLKTATTTEAFKGTVRQVVSQLSGYEITSVNDYGAVGCVIIASKRYFETSTFKPIWNKRDITMSSVTFRLEGDGKTIRISTRATANTGEGDPGAADKFANDLRDKVLAAYGKS